MQLVSTKTERFNVLAIQVMKEMVLIVQVQMLFHYRGTILWYQYLIVTAC